MTLVEADLARVDWSAAAAWVQAIGSVAAIGFSALVLRNAARREFRGAMERSDQFVDMVAAIATQSGHALCERSWLAAVQGIQDANKFRRGGLQALDRLMDTPLAAWPDPRLYGAAANFVAEVKVALETVDYVYANADSGVSWHSDLPEDAYERGRGLFSPAEMMANQQKILAHSLNALLETCRKSFSRLKKKRAALATFPVAGTTWDHLQYRRPTSPL